MPPSTVGAFLKRMSQSVVNREVAMRLQPSYQPEKTIPTREQILSLGRNKAREECKKAGLVQYGDAALLRKRLLQHYRL